MILDPKQLGKIFFIGKENQQYLLVKKIMRVVKIFEEVKVTYIYKE